MKHACLFWVRGKTLLMYLGGVSVLYLCNVKLITVATKEGDSLILHPDCFHLVLFSFLCCCFFFNETCRKHSWVECFLGIFFSSCQQVAQGNETFLHLWCSEFESLLVQTIAVTVVQACNSHEVMCCFYE